MEKRVTQILMFEKHSVGSETGYLLHGRSSILGRIKRFLSSIQLPDWLWDPPSFSSNGCRRLCPIRQRGEDIKETYLLSFSDEVKNDEDTPPLPLTPSWVVHN
jgi:hypothetical protein